MFALFPFEGIYRKIYYKLLVLNIVGDISYRPQAPQTVIIDERSFKFCRSKASGRHWTIPLIFVQILNTKLLLPS